MSKKISNLRGLFVEQGRELYNTSLQEVDELPKLRKKVSDKGLKVIIDRQLKTAKDQQNLLKNAFSKIKENPEGEKNQCCTAVFKKANDLMRRADNNEVRDATIINSIQRLNHNKIAGLGSLIAYAKEIEQPDIAASLHETLVEEKRIDDELSDLAEKEINRKAIKSKTFA